MIKFINFIGYKAQVRINKMTIYKLNGLDYYWFLKALFRRYIYLRAYYVMAD